MAQDSENFVFNPKIFKNIFKGCIWNKICSLVCLKENTEEKLNKFCVAFTMNKTNFVNFGGLKKILNKT